MNLVEKVQALLLSGGSAFGLDAATGVVRYLEERGFGHDTGVAKIPIVPTAILFDLAIGRSQIRPGAEEGYKACLAATEEVAEGSVGAGTGATVGKLLGIDRSTKAGIGTASQVVTGSVVVAALIAVNAFGDLFDPRNGRLMAGPGDPESKIFLSAVDLLKQEHQMRRPLSSNTTIGVVATNARLTKEQVNKLAQMAEAGVSQAIRPSHTMYDGDVLFALSIGDETYDVSLLGAVAVGVVNEAIIRAVLKAETLGGIPSVKDFVK